MNQNVRVFDAEQLKKIASEQHGFEDFGAGAYQCSFDKLCDSLSETAAFTKLGQEQTEQELISLLGNRLQIQHWLTECPEILSEKITRPVFATGLPRSGTTFLLHLFDQDPKLKLLRTWETSQPCPPPGHAPETIHTRIVKTRQNYLEMWKAAVPDFDAIHLMDAEGPDECTQLLSNDFAQVGFLNYLNVPGYFDWIVEHGDFKSTYQFHKKQLQLLQWKRTQKRWVLKYPNHLLAMDAIASVYQDARFVMTHRDPVKTLASLCNLTANFRGARSDRIDKLEIGRQILEFVKVHIDRLLAFSTANPSLICDVDYYSLVKNPLEVMESVYKFMDMELPDSVAGQIHNWVDENPQGKRGVHVYGLEDFGLNRIDVGRTFSAYRQKYNIPIEN